MYVFIGICYNLKLIKIMYAYKAGNRYKNS